MSKPEQKKFVSTEKELPIALWNMMGDKKEKGKERERESKKQIDDS